MMIPVNFADAERYTPTAFVDAARAVMGDTAHHPASAAAQSTIPLQVFYSVEKNCIKYDFHHRIWLDSPAGQHDARKFMRWVGEAYATGRVTESIVIVPACTAANWFQKLQKVAVEICFVRGLNPFLAADDCEAPPTHGPAIFYLGPNPDLFAKVFGKFGFVR